jgi:hypothetical protein
MASRKQRLLLQEFLNKDLQRLPDVFSIQEHKLREGETDRIRLEVLRDAKYIMCPAGDGLHAIQNRQVIEGKGGVGLAFHPLSARKPSIY